MLLVGQQNLPFLCHSGTFLAFFFLLLFHFLLLFFCNFFFHEKWFCAGNKFVFVKNQITIKVYLYSPLYPLTLVKDEDGRMPQDGPAPFPVLLGKVSDCVSATLCPSSALGGNSSLL